MGAPRDVRRRSRGWPGRGPTGLDDARAFSTPPSSPPAPPGPGGPVSRDLGGPTHSSAGERRRSLYGVQAPGGRGARGWGKRGSAGFCPAAPRRAPPAQRCPESVWPLGRHGQCTGDPRVLVRREGAGGGGRGAIIPRSPPTPPRDDRAPCHSVSNPSQSWPLRAALLSAPGHFHPPRAQTVALPPPTSTPPPRSLRAPRTVFQGP